MADDYIDMSRYVAIGDSVTAGYSDGALYYNAQLSAYPNLLAAQFKSYGCEYFKQPLTDENSIGIGFWGNSKLVLRRDPGTDTPAVLSYIAPFGDQEIFAERLYKDHGPFNNMGVPGLKAITTIMAGYGNPANGAGNYNPFFTRVASDPKAASVLEGALGSDPSFFTLFIGNNDVLAYALSGGLSDFITPPYAGETFFSFEGAIHTVVNALTAKGAKGAIANIPDIYSLPFFTSLPYNGLRVDKTRAIELNKKYASARLHIKEGNNPFIIQTSFGIRLMEDGEMLLMDVLLDPDKMAYLTGEEVIPKKYILTVAEIERIQESIICYNAILKAIATSKKLAFVDTNSLVKTLETDRIYSDKFKTLSFQKKRVFSLDGLHLNPLGHALLSNAFIQALNTTYNLAIPKINLIKYRRMTENE